MGFSCLSYRIACVYTSDARNIGFYVICHLGLYQFEFEFTKFSPPSGVSLKTKLQLYGG